MDLKLNFPESLPVSAKRDEIMALMREHQVVVVCGETGSGKTTQLPKMALALGRGRINGGGLIGHTQPRRIAASSVAKRIASELNTPLGEVVGYKVRFQDRLGPKSSVKLMTDGILLAETQTDPMLKAYDTIIIDEAHERSLNIDFLMGFLRQLLPRRPDLQVIVTSATIDADRFAQYFASRKGPAPVVQVSGRTFPVEVRWRPFEESKDADLNTAISDAVDDLWRGGGMRSAGDILVFLPGEREIREATDHLRKHLSHQPTLRDAEILPLFSRLSQAEQDRVFETGGQRRVVLATNVAETSLTVPGIRFVIDAGTARVKRYSYRQKVEQLLVEPISQAAANQRSGRCGRVADGIAIRLYAQTEFDARPRFTDPEILRSSLAAVILRMKALHLGDIEQFAFLDPPPRKAIVDGYQLLNELGAVDEANALTPIGRTLSKLPLDPRVGRMIVEAKARGALAEVMVIAASLSLQDVRDRPIEKQAQADQAHKKFDDERSEFSGILRLWAWLSRSRGGPRNDPLLSAWASGAKPEGADAQPSLRSQNAHLSPDKRGASRDGLNTLAKQFKKPGASKHASVVVEAVHKLSNRQYEQVLKESYVNIRRAREWRDIYSQLHTVVAEQGWTLNQKPAGYESLHLSLLA
ncbi:MAG: ATP-dependent RNA helicase HrpA, partial [Burkholderiaceae bacterium]|nr:ATP-dependent RNA helicase HrpA [Burkholderiaceae bacterium]